VQKLIQLVNGLMRVLTQAVQAVTVTFVVRRYWW